MPKSVLHKSSIPDQLILKEWLRFSLQSQSKVSRQLALAELFDQALDQELFELIKDISTEDPCETCQKMAYEIFWKRENQNELASLVEDFELTPQSFASLYDVLTPDFRREILKVDWKPPRAELLDLWRDNLISAARPELQTIGLELLAKYGTASDGSLGTMFLDSSNHETVKAAINLLHAQSPELFKTSIHPALRSPCIEVRFHAIGRLATLNVREACRFLNVAIESDDPLARRLCIKELERLEISKSEPSFIRLIGLESEPLLLVMAAIILMKKTKIDFPPHVYDALVMAKGVKKHILELMLRQMVKAISVSGLLTETPEKYLENLKTELENRRSEMTTILVLRDLRDSNTEVRRRALERLIPHSDDPRMQKALRIRAKKETDLELLDAINNLIDEKAGKSDSAQTSSLEEISPELFGEKPVKEKLAVLKKVATREEFLQIKPLLVPQLNEKTEKLVLGKILKLFQQYGEKKDLDFLLPLLKSKDPVAIRETLRAISQIDFEEISTFINPLLRSDNLTIKSTALEVFIDCDQEGALQYLSSMLLSPVTAIRMKGLSLAPLVDFSAIEEEIVTILQKDLHPEIQELAGALLASNPSAKRLKMLFVMASSEGLLKPLWDNVRPVAASFFDLEQEKVDAWLQTQIENEGIPNFCSRDKESASKKSGQIPDDEAELSFLDIIFDRSNLIMIGAVAIVFFFVSAVQNQPWKSSKPYVAPKIPLRSNNKSKETVKNESAKNISRLTISRAEKWQTIPYKWSGMPGFKKTEQNKPSSLGESR